MKTWNLEAESAEFDRLHPSTDCVCERIVASEAVQAVKPLRPTLDDHIDHLERDIAYSGHIAGLLDDCEALNDEIAHLREVALRAQQREVSAVKRCDGLEAALHDIYYLGYTAKARAILKGRL